MQGVKWYVEHNKQGAVVFAECPDGYALRVAMTNEQVLMIRNAWPLIEQMTFAIKRHLPRRWPRSTASCTKELACWTRLTF